MFIPGRVGGKQQYVCITDIYKHDQAKAMLPIATTQIYINIYQ
jgi:hypothetical protein